ncbi:MAG: LacI family transcriptional regulator [Betaproteobacteria bacterium]|nr:LacI family transcriptional regulator [Betaproteobacteria bacterium]
MTTLAIFTKNRSNPAYAAARLGAARAAQRLGANTVHYVPDKADDVDEQIALIDAAIRGRPDAVVLVPVHPTKVNAAIRRIVDAGIPLIGFLNPFSEAGPLTYVGADDFAIGLKIATYLYEHLGGRGDVVILEGAAHSVTSAARVRGFHDALKRFPSIRIVATLCGDYLREPAKHAVTALLKSGTAFDAILAANDEMALGAIDVLDAAARNCTVVGVNAIPDAIAAIREDRLLATADFNTMDIGAIAAEAAVRHLRGETLPREIILPVEIVDRANYAAWDRPFEQRDSRRWEDTVKS